MKHVRIKPVVTYECDYDIVGISSLSTDLSSTSPEESDQEALDRAFIDTIKEEHPVLDRLRPLAEEALSNLAG